MIGHESDIILSGIIRDPAVLADKEKFVGFLLGGLEEAWEEWRERDRQQSARSKTNTAVPPLATDGC